jgi:hypothetical protein
MKRNLILKFLLGIAAIAILMISTLAIHIYMVTKPNAEYHTNWQLSRIDFEAPIDSVQAHVAISSIKRIEGVQRAILNAEAGTLVFAFDPQQYSSEKIYTHFQKMGFANTSLFIPTEDQLATSCPIMDKTSISYRIGVFFQNLFSGRA